LINSTKEHTQCLGQSIVRCTLDSVLSGVTIEAEAGMTVYGQCWCQVKSVHYTAPPPLMYAMYVNVWVMCCSCYYSNSACK